MPELADGKVERRYVEKLRRIVRPGGPLRRASLNQDARLTLLARRLQASPPPRLPEAAKVVGLSAGYFSEYFRLRVGEPFSRFRCRLCLYRSCARLSRENQAHLDDVAVEVGFSSRRQMERAFRAALGVTPRDAAVLLRLVARGSGFWT